MPMLVLDELETRNALPFPDLLDSIERLFQVTCVAPTRHHHTVGVPGEPDATLLLMPAWEPGRYLGVKMVSVFPGNGQRGLPAISGSYILSSAVTGELLALIDGGELTARRTAAASALAAKKLARTDASVMMMIGTGRLSGNLIEAHMQVRPLKTVLIWGRSPDKAESVAVHARGLGLEAIIVDSLEQGCRKADIISCATLSHVPLVQGAWLKPGTHVDLVGAFKPGMRESDDTTVLRSVIYVDTREGALCEGGDLVQPIADGIITQDHIKGDLFDLVSGISPGRTNDADITLFKSVGTALEDLAGAILAFEHVSQANDSEE
jgi:ornithine cyclodeaminase/alanine dehydrogenase-like protein (mu-crystallin family)